MKKTSCVVATLFIIVILIILSIIFFTHFSPKTPQISIASIQITSFSLSNNTITFTLFQLVSVRNPNRVDLMINRSSLRLMYLGAQIGFMILPTGKIESGRTASNSLNFTVDHLPLLPPSLSSSIYGSSSSQAVEIEIRMKMSGKVRVLKVFTHSVDFYITCDVSISVRDSSIVGFRCS